MAAERPNVDVVGKDRVLKIDGATRILDTATITAACHFGIGNVADNGRIEQVHCAATVVDAAAIIYCVVATDGAVDERQTEAIDPAAIASRIAADRTVNQCAAAVDAAAAVLCRVAADRAVDERQPRAA